MKLRHVALRAPAIREGRNLWVAQALLIEHRFFNVVVMQAAVHQKGVGGNAQGGAIKGAAGAAKGNVG